MSKARLPDGTLCDWDERLRAIGAVEIEADPDCPAYREGWMAHFVGRPLYEGHTAQYQMGWEARDAYVGRSDR